ncbi:hypothetical protein Thiowin_02468 [Thiorhodovibrio winogradskyi]|uniref:DUF2249 domain-containing protein n=1 Tax=Thiorhodovibrio winogradskyi TaxID=77007 RepID=A0ABZ0SAA4_9GAMM|nr:DUF2249 domain-containing protein [Thiorhodovibrio winogradskyi]
MHRAEDDKPLEMYEKQAGATPDDSLPGSPLAPYPSPLNTRYLDVSTLPPPEPLEQTLDALGRLKTGERLIVHHRRQPYPLYDLLKRLGYRWEASGTEGGWRILIEADPAAADPLARPLL